MPPLGFQTLQNFSPRNNGRNTRKYGRNAFKPEMGGSWMRPSSTKRRDTCWLLPSHHMSIPLNITLQGHMENAGRLCDCFGGKNEGVILYTEAARDPVVRKVGATHTPLCPNHVLVSYL